MPFFRNYIPTDISCYRPCGQFPPKKNGQNHRTHPTLHFGKAGTHYLEAHPRNPQLAEPCQFFSKKEGLLFSLINYPALPIGRGESNQWEQLASPDSPSPRASLATLLFLIGRAGEAQRQSCRRQFKWIPRAYYDLNSESKLPLFSKFQLSSVLSSCF